MCVRRWVFSLLFTCVLTKTVMIESLAGRRSGGMLVPLLLWRQVRGLWSAAIPLDHPRFLTPDTLGLMGERERERERDRARILETR